LSEPLCPADAELKLKVEAMHAAQAKIALLKNQAQEADAALAGAVSVYGFVLVLFGS
jgi:hypothetical protein